MAHSAPLIRSSLLSEFPALVAELGGSIGPVLEETGLTLEQIEQPTLLIPFEKQIKLLQVAAGHCQREAFGLELAKRQDIAVFGALSLLAMQCPTIEQGLRLFGRYLHYSVQAVKLDLWTQNDLGHLLIDTQYTVARESDQFWDHSVATAFSLMSVLCGQGWKPRAVYLRRPEPIDPNYYSQYFRCPVAFGSDASELVFERGLLQQPISRSIDSVPGQLQTYLRDNFAGDFLEQMRRVIISLLPTEDCNAKTVARCMGYSLRSLQRKLAAEQTGFQRQLDGIRSELAINYLQEPQFSLTDIGALLGFAELSVFSRTFKRWFGVTPSQWRNRRFG
ncbi:MAG: AraC family transcriptional regulator [Halioglobus sp.]